MCIWNRPRQRGQFRDLRMIQPGIEAQFHRREFPQPLAEPRILHQPGRCRVAGVQRAGVSVRGGDVADAAEPIAAGADMRLKHRLHPGAQQQVRVTDNAGADARRAVDAAGAHGSDAVDELGLPDRLHVVRAGGAMKRARLHEHRGSDLVPAVQVGEQLRQQIAPVRPVPQMMVRIDDRQVGLQDRLVPAREPILSHPQVMGLGGVAAHCDICLRLLSRSPRRRPAPARYTAARTAPAPARGA